MRARILVVSADTAFRVHLAGLLGGSGYAVELAESATHVDRLSLKDIALAIVNPVGLGADPRSLMEKLCAVTGKDVLVARSGETSAPRPAAIAASDATVLLDRVRQAIAPAVQADEPSTILNFAHYSLDLAGQSLADRLGKEVPLTRREYGLLREFLRRPGRVISREDLLQVLSGRSAEAYDRSVDMLVVRLRRKIEPDPKRPSLIIAIPGSGYKFTAAVQAVEIAKGPAAAKPSTPLELPERRQITALSAELVAGHGDRLPADPEELRPLLDAFRRRVATIVAQHEGLVAQYVANEVLAYFGHPVAQEDAAERAIHAGLAMAQVPVHATPEHQCSPFVRVGVATGLVIAAIDGELIGDALADAARVRSLAEPRQVVVSAGARQRGGALFSYRSFQPMTPNGMPGPTMVWEVVAPRAPASHSEALVDGALTPLAGRKADLELLLNLWRRVERHQGRVVLLSGEPGVGKSRLLIEFDQLLIPQRYAALRYFCSSLHKGTALHPIIARWEQDIGYAHEDCGGQRLSKLEAILAEDGLAPTDVALLADMLGVPTDGKYHLPELTPQRRKEQTFAALNRRLASIARRQPVFMLFEDVHWADQTLLELLDELVNKIATLPILLVISFRPEFVPPWGDRAGVNVITLGRLDRTEAAELLNSLSAAQPLPPPLAERIIAQTDGVPLFIEEVTKAVIETSVDGTSLTLDVPSTLQASIMARLDRLPAAKQIAQIGAVIGRRFPQSLLNATAGLDETRVRAGLNELIGAGLMFRRGRLPEEIYTFKHALVQEVAYDSLLKTRRRELHRRVAEIVRDDFPEWSAAEPEMVARHFTQADLPALAVEWWSKAGEQALRRAAFADAIEHLETAIRLFGATADGDDERNARVRLQITYGNALRIARGFGVTETQAAFAVARDLAVAADSVQERFPAYYGLWSGSFIRGELAEMQQTAVAFLRDAETVPASPENAVAHRITGMTDWFEGNFRKACKHLKQALTINASARDSDLMHRFGQDPDCVAMIYLGLALWPLGFVDRARSLFERVVAQAEATGHIPTIAYAHGHAVTFETMQGDAGRATLYAESLTRIAREHGMAVWIAFGAFYDGWLRSAAGDRAVGIAAMHEGLRLMRLQEQELFLPMLITRLAETEAEVGRAELGLAALDGQLASIERTGQRWFLSEIHRARGEILLTWRPDDAAQAEAAFIRALDTARSQSADLFERRAAESLGRLRRSFPLKEARRISR